MTSDSTINFRIQPGARRNEISGEYGNGIKVRLTAPPEQGKANQALISLLAEKTRLKENQISIIRGHTSRNKVVVFNGIEETEVRKKLLD